MIEIATEYVLDDTDFKIFSKYGPCVAYSRQLQSPWMIIKGRRPPKFNKISLLLTPDTKTIVTKLWLVQSALVRWQIVACLNYSLIIIGLIPSIKNIIMIGYINFSCMSKKMDGTDVFLCLITCYDFRTTGQWFFLWISIKWC